MSIPDFQSIMLPVLKMVADEKEYALIDVKRTLATQFNMTEAERLQTLGNRREKIFDNRVSWAKAHLQNAGLIKPSKHGHFVITDEGKKALNRVVN